jgi:hypothetical protein
MASADSGGVEFVISPPQAVNMHNPHRETASSVAFFILTSPNTALGNESIVISHRVISCL